MSWQSVRNLALGVLLAGLAALLSLAGAEVLVRVIAPQQLMQFRPDIWMPRDTLGWTFRPNVSARINSGDGWATIYTDERGFRVGEDGRQEGHQRVVLIGDSYMAAVQVDHEETLAGLMEAELGDELGEPVEVWNTAVPAWDPPHYLIKARRLLESEEAVDLILVAVYLGNDIVDWTREAFAPRHPSPRPQLRLPRQWAWGEWIEAIARPLDSELRQRSHLHILARTATSNLRMRLGLTSSSFPREYLAEEADSPRWENTAKLLAEIDAIAHDQGVPALFFLIPPKFQVDEAGLDRHLRVFDVDPADFRIDQPNELLGQRLEERGLQVLDATSALRQAVADGALPYGEVDTHFSSEGHEITWRVIREAVVDLLQDRRD